MMLAMFPLSVVSEEKPTQKRRKYIRVGSALGGRPLVRERDIRVALFLASDVLLTVLPHF